jgi:hypothetical protein
MTEQSKTMLDENYAAFRELLPVLLVEHRGRFAVMHDRKLQAIFDTARDAFVHVSKLYQPGDYAIQEITDIPVSLGFYSHAVPCQYV